MIAKIYSAIPQGYDGQIVEVEGDSNRGLPAFNIVGMAAKTVSEARERVRAAITNSGFQFPTKKVTINLAPAELIKDGSQLDLPIAVSVLALSGQLQISDLHKYLFAGELSLDGNTRPIRGIINIVEAARDHGFKEIIIPRDNLAQASLVPNANITGVSNLIELFLHLHGQLPPSRLNTKNINLHNFSTQNPLHPLNSPVVKNTCSESNPYYSNYYNKGNDTLSTADTPPNNSALKHAVKNNKTEMTVKPSVYIVKITQTETNSDSNKSVVKNTPTDKSDQDHPLIDHVQGQSLAKRALTIAVAGHHNILLSGPPGAGKTLLAKVARNLLPAPSPEEMLEVTKLYSLLDSNFHNIYKLPFRSPHHTASTSSILGGGPHALPGEISLAHQGILFLDELPEFPRNVLEALRQPLEDHAITISRANYRCVYPANFMLIATMNPCPCGHFGDSFHPCICTHQQISNYHKKLSGPILDRIDLIIPVKPVKSADFLVTSQKVVKNTKTDSIHNVVKNKIIAARRIQAARYQIPNHFNSSLTNSEITSHFRLSTQVQGLLKTASEKLHLSARSYFKTIKVARTIADLEAAPEITTEHLTEALSYREMS